MKNDNRGTSGKSGAGWLIFLVGLVVALVMGWVVFPKLLYSEKPQPFNFSHAAHQDSTCEDCHSFRPDGTYSGIPKLDKCRECHEAAIGQSKNEAILVEEYIQKEREIPWRVYAWQPDNVYFSHAPHKAKNIECVQCHHNMDKQTIMPVFSENRITGYSRDTMKMDVCEKCHAERGGSNSCQVCHK